MRQGRHFDRIVCDGSDVRESAIGLIGSLGNEKQPPIVGRAVMLGRNLAKSECFLQNRQTHVTAIACQIGLIEQMRK